MPVVVVTRFGQGRFDIENFGKKLPNQQKACILFTNQPLKIKNCKIKIEKLNSFELLYVDDDFMLANNHFDISQFFKLPILSTRIFSFISSQKIFINLPWCLFTRCDSFYIRLSNFFFSKPSQINQLTRKLIYFHLSKSSALKFFSDSPTLNDELNN